jgi:hypothetical protein
VLLVVLLLVVLLVVLVVLLLVVLFGCEGFASNRFGVCGFSSGAGCPLQLRLHTC